MIFTRLLNGILESYGTKLSEADFQSLKKHIELKTNEYRLLLTHYSPGLERGKFIHQLMEREISTAAHIKTSCKKGCGTCCHFEVDITDDDAEVLAEAVALGVKIDLGRLEHLATRDRKADDWQLGPVAENRCVFLDLTNSCSAYEHRPSSCRKHAVTSPAELCAQIEANNIKVRMIPMAEVIQSATLNLGEGSFGSFAKMLLRKLKERGLFTEEVRALSAIPVVTSQTKNLDSNFTPIKSDP